MTKSPGPKLPPEAIKPIRQLVRNKFKIWQLANQCELSPATIHKFLSGKSVDLETFYKISETLGLNPIELLQHSQNSDDRGNDIEFLHLQNSNLQEDLTASSKKHNYIPELPPYTLIKGHDIHALKHLILSTSTNKVGVLGMAGIGKTVLVSALAQDKDVYEAFVDGIFYLVCGQERSLTSLQMQLATALGYAPQPFADKHDGRTFLSQQIGYKKCLIILDDVWQLKQINAFDALGANCKILITTQNQELLTASGSEKYEVKLLNEQDALELLSHWSGQDAKNLVPARDVANQCEGLPLALALCGAQIRDGDSWEDLRDALQETQIGVLNHQLGSVERALKISVDGLIKENAENGWLYQMLAVFSKNAVIPEAAILTLWLYESSLNERKARQLITRLARKALLTVSGEQGKRLVRLHGLQHSYLCNTLNSLESLNDKLLRAYQSKCSTGWGSGPNDGYYLEHLVEHLLKSNRKSEIYELLIGSPDWMQRKFKDCQGDTAYVSDLNLALSTFCGSLTSAQLLLLAQLCTARQAISWRASSYSDTELQVLVQLNRQAEALSHVRLRADAEERFKGLLTIYKLLDGEVADIVRKEMVKIINEIKPPQRHLYARNLFEQELGMEVSAINTEEQNQKLPKNSLNQQSSSSALSSLEKSLSDYESSLSDEQRKKIRQASNLNKIVSSFLKLNRYDDAKLLISHIEITSLKDFLLEKYIQAAIADQKLDLVKEQLNKISSPEVYSSSLINLASALASNQMKTEAERLFNHDKLTTQNSRERLLDLEQALLLNVQLGKTLFLMIEAFIKAGCLSEGEKVVERIKVPVWKILIQIALARSYLERNSKEEVKEHLEKAKKIAGSIQYHANFPYLVLDEIDTYLSHLNQKMVDKLTFIDLTKSIERFEQAYIDLRTNALFDLGLTEVYIEGVIQAKPISEDYQKYCKEVVDESIEIHRELSEELLSNQDFCQSFKVLDSQNSYSFFLILSFLTPSFEKFEKKLSLKILRETTRIAGWLYPQWNAVSEIFQEL